MPRPGRTSTLALSQPARSAAARPMNASNQAKAATHHLSTDLPALSSRSR